MEKDVEEFCAYLAKVYVKLMALKIPPPNVNCWMAQAIMMFYMQKTTNMNLEFDSIIKKIKGESHAE
ncbi:hypothetical protein [Sulfuricurvum sp.]|uniref:hypothetical protein n=1 Tax=Sulfuricurvum sp. TaxID=2025608 RepID=UPI00356989AB